VIPVFFLVGILGHFNLEEDLLLEQLFEDPLSDSLGHERRHR
jgi:hypothetical protein